MPVCDSGADGTNCTASACPDDMRPIDAVCSTEGHTCCKKSKSSGFAFEIQLI